MKTLFERGTYEEILRRVDSIQPGSQRQWGKMTPGQMLEHNARALAMAAGGKPHQQALLGKMIGWMFKGQFTGEKPFGRNGPTGPDFVVRDEPDFTSTKEKVKRLVSELHQLGEKGCDGNTHGFFGRLTGAEWGVTQYKHLDHHLRQFGA